MCSIPAHPPQTHTCGQPASTTLACTQAACPPPPHIATMQGDAAKQANAAAAEPVSVPVDDSQPCCALSGERFDQFWDRGHDQWRYRGAVRLDEEQAARCVPSARGLGVAVWALVWGPSHYYIGVSCDPLYGKRC